MWTIDPFVLLLWPWWAGSWAAPLETCFAAFRYFMQINNDLKQKSGTVHRLTWPFVEPKHKAAQITKSNEGRWWHIVLQCAGNDSTRGIALAFDKPSHWTCWTYNSSSLSATIPTRLLASFPCRYWECSQDAFNFYISSVMMIYYLCSVD